MPTNDEGRLPQMRGRPSRKKFAVSCDDRSRRCVSGADSLSTQAESLDQRPVALDVDVLQITQQAAALANEQQQATT